MKHFRQALVAVLATAILTLTASAATYKETTLYTFHGSKDGSQPDPTLVADSAGNLYGSTIEGGPGCSKCGAIYELSPNSSGGYTETILYGFKGGTDGESPEGNLLMDSSGNLFGVTFFGGSSANGTVFELSPSASGWTESILYNFTGISDGGAPVALIFDGQGGFYGAAQQGANGGGAIFQLSPNSSGGWTESTVFAFTTAQGQEPESLIMDPAGNLIGTNRVGGDTKSTACGNGGCGTVWILEPSGGTWTPGLLYTFHYAGGSLPQGRIALDSAGNLYGGTLSGGLSYGVVYQLAPTAVGEWKETILHRFTNGTDGLWPVGGISIAPNGAIYGGDSTGISGPFNIFRFTQSPSGGWVFAIVYTSTGVSSGGFAPSYFDAAGNLYGVAQAGTQGIVYELTP